MQARAFRGALGATARAVSLQWKNPDFLLKNPDFLLKNVDFLIIQALHAGESSYWETNAALGAAHETGYISWYADAAAPPRNLMDQIALESLLPNLPEEAVRNTVNHSIIRLSMEKHHYFRDDSPLSLYLNQGHFSIVSVFSIEINLKDRACGDFQRAKVVGVEYWAHRMDPKGFAAVSANSAQKAFDKGAIYY